MSSEMINWVRFDKNVYIFIMAGRFCVECFVVGRINC